MPACGGWVEKGAPPDPGITQRWGKLYPQALPPGTWASGTHCSHPRTQPSTELTTNKERALAPPRESEILNLISREWIPCTCL